MEDLNDATECLSSAVRFFEKTFDCPLPSYCHKLVFVKNVPCVNSFASSTYSSMTIVSTDHLYPKSMHIPNNNSDGTANPLNPNLDEFGENLSILVSTYYIPADKVAISPYIERF